MLSVWVSADGQWAVSVAIDGVLRLWDRRGSENREWARHHEWVNSVSVSANGQWAVSGAEDGTVRLWDCQGGLGRELGRHEGRVESVSVSADGRWAVSGSDDRSVRLWDRDDAPKAASWVDTRTASTPCRFPRTGAGWCQSRMVARSGFGIAGVRLTACWGGQALG